MPPAATRKIPAPTPTTSLASQIGSTIATSPPSKTSHHHPFNSTSTALGDWPPPLGHTASQQIQMICSAPPMVQQRIPISRTLRPNFKATVADTYIQQQHWTQHGTSWRANVRMNTAACFVNTGYDVKYTTSEQTAFFLRASQAKVFSQPHTVAAVAIQWHQSIGLTAIRAERYKRLARLRFPLQPPTRHAQRQPHQSTGPRRLFGLGTGRARGACVCCACVFVYVAIPHAILHTSASQRPLGYRPFSRVSFAHEEPI